jgi:hypothetical protein
MIGFSDETLMTSIPWDEIQEWFAARAKAAGHSIYEHSELFDLSSALDPDVEAAAQQMSFNLGRSISELLTKG